MPRAEAIAGERGRLDLPGFKNLEGLLLGPFPVTPGQGLSK
jgi:hypothetical protein